MTRAELLSRISSAELSEWMVYYQLEPFGQETQYIGPAITSAILANVNRKKGDKPHSASDFMPKFEKEEKSPEQMLSFAAMITAGLGGKIGEPE